MCLYMGVCDIHIEYKKKFITLYEYRLLSTYYTSFNTRRTRTISMGRGVTPPHNLCDYFQIFKNVLKLAKPILRFLYFCFFSTLRHCTFILRHCILVFLFSYRFRPSQPQNRRPGFFLVVDICTALGFPQLHIGSFVAAPPPSSSIFCSQIY